MKYMPACTRRAMTYAHVCQAGPVGLAVCLASQRRGGMLRHRARSAVTTASSCVVALNAAAAASAHQRWQQAFGVAYQHRASPSGAALKLIIGCCAALWLCCRYNYEGYEEITPAEARNYHQVYPYTYTLKLHKEREQY